MTTITGIADHRSSVLNLPASDVIEEISWDENYHLYKRGEKKLDYYIYVDDIENVSISGTVYDCNITCHFVYIESDNSDNIEKFDIGITELKLVLSQGTFIAGDNWIIEDSTYSEYCEKIDQCLLAIGLYWTLLYENTTPGNFTYDLPSGYNTIGIFLVGGGGGGHGDFYASGRAGNGGNGGQVRSWQVSKSGKDSPRIAGTVGAGGTGGSANSQGNNTDGGTNGGNTIVSYNNIVYTASGGYRGIDTVDTPQTKQDYSGCGGYPIFSTAWAQVALQGKAGEGSSFTYNGNTYSNVYYGNGGDGTVDPFSSSSTTAKYGAGGGGGANSYGGVTSYRGAGGINGGGRGGGGSNNASSNKGANGSVAGAGGGGAAFGSNHTYSQGGNGAAGMVRIYGINL